MPVAILFPRYDHPAIEERYASWQSEMLLHRQADELHHYDFDESARHAVLDIQAEHVFVATDPLVLPAPDLVERLGRLLSTTGSFAVVPSTNEPEHARQAAGIAPYITLRELENEASGMREQQPATEQVVWDGADPGAYLCATASLADIKEPLGRVLAGKQVTISRGDFIHRWASLRGQRRDDLLERITLDAKSVLEFGCGEGALGEALKKRQKCRVVGIELDRRAAAIARKRLDDVYQGDVLEIVSLIHEEFDWIIGGDIVEHLTEPWSFLAELRRISKPDGRLLLSLPNIANASIIGDLLQGRFDYVYMGLTCVGHLRFFTRRTIEDMLAIAGWSVESIEPQTLLATTGHSELLARLEAASIPFSRDDLQPTGYYVIARNHR
ncbi:MAG TPA: class I SAM-dependent methyltransferase [Thermoanaerobaculia bacterium]